MSELGNSNKIEMYIHCKRCIDEVSGIDDESPLNYSRYSAGWTELGIQIWCNRHDCNVVNIDFEGHQHPANTTRIDTTPKLKIVSAGPHAGEHQP